MSTSGLDVPWPLSHPPEKMWVFGGWYCAVAMGITGLNGYVRIPETSPLRDYSSYDDMDVEVHGGITYGPFICEEFTVGEILFPRLEKTWAETKGWVGFDTSHLSDVWDLDELTFQSPAHRQTAESLTADILNESGLGIVRWTKQKVVEETEWLCSQLQSAEYALSERETNATDAGRTVQEDSPSSDAGSP